MIRLEALAKRYHPEGRPAVDGLSLDVPEGSIAVLIGPSGCGKTTTLRMINRLVEPSAGRVLVAGEDVARADPALLRRRIGYVIQQIGLFPHMTVADNVATVPRLLGWARPRISARVDELLHLVGLDAAATRQRLPRELSGGQRQRVGVARSLAADPPVLLMDEPFGAVDPVVRGRLRSEILALLRTMRKTIVFVTHDIDEAIRMGDRIAILREGRLAQHGSPGEILTRPADAFVEDFVGADRALKRLSLIAAADALAPPGANAPLGPSIAPETDLRDALSLLLASRAREARVVGGDGGLRGRLTLDMIVARAGMTEPSAGVDQRREKA